jgi:hypothetical protein
MKQLLSLPTDAFSRVVFLAGLVSAVGSLWAAWVLR